MKHYVYLCLDCWDEPIYVGLSNNVDLRMDQHRLEFAWINEVAHVVTSAFDTREEAAAHEKQLIRQLKPRENVYHGGARGKREPQGRPSRGTVQQTYTLPDEMLAAIKAEAQRQGHNNRSTIVLLAVTDYLNRMNDPRAA